MAGQTGGGPVGERAGRAGIAAEARMLVRRALKGALATLRGAGRDPYASLVTVATDPAGAPLMLLSGLAVHTRNIAADDRASLLIDATSGAGDPLAGGRISLSGRVTRLAAGDATAAARFLARHDGARQYAGFGDFAFYRLDVTGGHFVGGFGRIVDLSPADLILGLDGAAGLVAAESEIVAHLNEAHAATASLYATALLGETPGDWRVSGIDPEGVDLMAGERTARVAFEARVATPEQARAGLVQLSARARSAKPG